MQLQFSMNTILHMVLSVPIKAISGSDEAVIPARFFV